MGFSIAPLQNTATKTLVHRFIDKHFPGCDIEGISEVAGHYPYTEYDVWIKDHPFLAKITLDNGWSPTNAVTDTLYLKKVLIYADMELIPDNKTYHKMVKTLAMFKEVLSEIVE